MESTVYQISNGVALMCLTLTLGIIRTNGNRSRLVSPDIIKRTECHSAQARMEKTITDKSKERSHEIKALGVSIDRQLTLIQTNMDSRIGDLTRAVLNTRKE